MQQEDYNIELEFEQHNHAFNDQHDQQNQHNVHHYQQTEQPLFPGSPYDLSILKDYEHHIAVKIAIPELRPLQRCSLHMIDGNLIYAFAERWHTKTSSFHPPFGEMTITLDNVRSLLGIPCYGEFFTHSANVNEDLAIGAAIELLGVDHDEAVTETGINRGASYSFEWLKAIFFKQLREGRYNCATRAYLLHLVGCIILADKKFTLVSAKYLFLFQYLDTCGKWAWGPAALVVLYDYLRDGTLSAMK
uniref:Protein MAIN-LIKE 1-like n=1 Tax=Cicer arietinum TaxID=3827 RepID=A0A1S3EAT1_CICAR|nr:protein MAIN-LIKE 1-like [Cicer arietinum]